MEVRREDVLALQRAYVDRIRSRDEPVDVEWEGLTLVVLPGVFPPYLDSGLVANAMEVEPGDRVLEVGTGSGAIAVAAALRGGRVAATDIQPAAVRNVLENARRHGVSSRLRGFEVDLFPAAIGPFDVVVFNPPYTDHPAEDRIERSVWDPGHATVRRFLDGLPRILAPSGRLYLGWADFADLELVEELLSAAGMEWQRAGSARDPTSLFVAYRAVWARPTRAGRSGELGRKLRHSTHREPR